MGVQTILTQGAQARGPFPDETALDLGHARGRRAFPWGERKDMEVGQVAGGHMLERVVEHLVRFRGKARDEIRAEDHVRSRGPQGGAHLDGLVRTVPALHSLQDERVPGLKRQV